MTHGKTWRGGTHRAWWLVALMAIAIGCGGSKTKVDAVGDLQPDATSTIDSDTMIADGLQPDVGDAEAGDQSETTDASADTAAGDVSDDASLDGSETITPGHLKVTIERRGQLLTATVFLHEDTGDSGPAAPALDSCLFSQSHDSGTITVPPLGYDLGASAALSIDAKALLLFPDAGFSYDAETDAAFFVSNSSYTLKWNGGTSEDRLTFPGLELTLASPKLLVGLSPDPLTQSGLTIPRDQPLAFSWSKNDAGDSEIWIAVTHQLPGNPPTISSLRCRATDDGSFALPKEELAKLPDDAQYKCFAIRLYRERQSAFSHPALLSSQIRFRDVYSGTFCFQ